MNPSIFVLSLTLSVLATSLSLVACAQSVPPGEMIAGLERKLDKPLDETKGATIEYGSIATRDGAKLRTIFSKPENATTPVPAIYFVQWLSCSTVELKDDDGWTQMLTHLIGKSGYAVLRTEKAGVGDSQGPACSDLDYNTEVSHHRESLGALLARSDIDRDNVFVFGGSMGANQAALIANDLDVAGFIVWGGGAKTWYERMLGFDRRSLEFSLENLATLNETLMARAAFHTEYLVKGKSPKTIIAENPKMEAIWSNMIGTDTNSHYGRPFAFHHQAQAANWPSAWTNVSVPVLVLYGEYDWFDDADSHKLIADIVNRSEAGLADFRILPGTNHHFSRYPNAKAAFDETGGTMVGDEAAIMVTDWVTEHINASK